MDFVPKKPLRVSTDELDDNKPTVQPCPIASAFEQAVDSFKKLYITLASEQCIVTSQFSITQVSDEYGRLGVWGRSSGAERQGRGSLDDNLRSDPNLTSIILDSLKDLREDLETATQIACKGAKTTPENSRRGSFESSDSDDLSSISSGSDKSSIRGTEIGLHRGSLSRALSLIFEHIRSLYKVSALLRRPKVQDKYIKSVTKDSSKAKALHFLAWDQAHVAEKMWQWALDEEQKYESRIDSTNYMCARAAAANVRRREQLTYWQSHPDHPFREATTTIQEQQPLKSLPKPLHALATGVLPSASPLNSDPPPKIIVPAPTENTVQSFSTVAQSVLNDNETFSGRPKTIYAPSTTGARRGARVPNLPDQADRSLNFECPYCLTTLNSKSMQQRQLWKKHVFRDLRPYICTFENCSNPEQMYVTRHDWLYHEMQMHRRRWICSGECEETFKTKAAMELHLRDKHTGTFTELQLPVILDICERPADPNEVTLCPMCPAELALSRLQIHLANHLEEIALFVLPVYMSDRSQKSGSNQGANSANSSRMGDLSSLGSFSEPLEHSTVDNIDRTSMFKNIKDNVENPTIEIQSWLATEAESGDVGDNGHNVDNLQADYATYESTWKGPGIYFCTECGSSYKTKEDFALHERAHEQQLQQGSWFCDQCSASRDSMSELALHLLEDHSLVMQEGREVAEMMYWVPARIKYAWGCGFCGACLTTWQARINHVAEHYEQGNNISQWSPKLVITGLLKQDAPEFDVAKAWGALVNKAEKPNWDWPLDVAKSLQRKLEFRKGSPSEIAEEAWKQVMLSPVDFDEKSHEPEIPTQGDSSNSPERTPELTLENLKYYLGDRWSPVNSEELEIEKRIRYIEDFYPISKARIRFEESGPDTNSAKRYFLVESSEGYFAMQRDLVGGILIGTNLEDLWTTGKEKIEAWEQAIYPKDKITGRQILKWASSRTSLPEIAPLSQDESLSIYKSMVREGRHKHRNNDLGNQSSKSIIEDTSLNISDSRARYVQ